MKLSKEWRRLAGLFRRAADAVRRADLDRRVSDAEYGALVTAREEAFAALAACKQPQPREQPEAYHNGYDN